MTSPIPPNHPENFTKLKCQPSTIICREKTVILGDVTIGADCVIHPTTQILALAGPIVIGSNNLIEERVVITNHRAEPMVIGHQNVFEVDSHCEAPRVGNNNTLECKCNIGAHIELTDNCVIGAGCQLKLDEDNTDAKGTKEIFEPNTVVSGRGLDRRVVKDLPASLHTCELDFLRKILPNYQKLWRPANIPAAAALQR